MWFKNDPRVANVKVAGGVHEPDRSWRASSRHRGGRGARSRPLPPRAGDDALAEIADQWAQGMPPAREPAAEHLASTRCTRAARSAASTCVIHGNSNYKQTGLLQAWAAISLLQQPPRRAGFASGCQAFGHRELLGVLRQFGLVLEPGVTVTD